MAVEKLTDKTARDLQPLPVGTRVVWDDQISGFGLRCTASGAKAWLLNYRSHGIQRQLTIGKYPAWPAKAARDEAAKLRRLVDQGEDPMRDRHEQREAPTVNALADRYLAEHASRKRPGSVKEDTAMLRQLIRPALGRMRVAAVRRSDVEALHRDVSKRTPPRANRALALLKTMFSLSIGWEMRTDNPCRGIQRNHEEPRRRYLKPDELGRLMAALAGHPIQSSATIVRLALLTGCRRGELLGATWDQFDLEAGTWTKPFSAVKQKRTHSIPLSAPARQLLSELAAQSEGRFLFPGRDGNETQTTLKGFWAGVCKTAGIEGVRFHDLRHSYASYLVSAGLSLPVIGALLGHSQASTTQRYAHLLDDPLRAATEKVGAIVDHASAGKPAGGAEVLPFKGRAG